MLKIFGETYHIDFDKIEQSYYSTVGSFFSKPEFLSLNFAGNQEETFLGKIFSLTNRKLSKK